MSLTLNNKGYLRDTTTGQLEHVRVVEAVLGRKLPYGPQVHHIDDNKENNANDNLVLCQDSAYHKLLHSRAKAYDEFGNANHRKCQYCQTYDDPLNLFIGEYETCTKVYHPACNAKRSQQERNKS